MPSSWDHDEFDKDGGGPPWDNEFVPDNESELPHRGRGRPKGPKNKPKAPTQAANAAPLVQREQEDVALSYRLRANRKIITPESPFELSTKAEMDC